MFGLPFSTTGNRTNCDTASLYLSSCLPARDSVASVQQVSKSERAPTMSSMPSNHMPSMMSMARSGLTPGTRL